MAVWQKKSGMKIEINDDPQAVAEAKRLGWQRLNVETPNPEGEVTPSDVMPAPDKPKGRK